MFQLHGLMRAPPTEPNCRNARGVDWISCYLVERTICAQLQRPRRVLDSRPRLLHVIDGHIERFNARGGQRSTCARHSLSTTLVPREKACPQNYCSKRAEVDWSTDCTQWLFPGRQAYGLGSKSWPTLPMRQGRSTFHPSGTAFHAGSAPIRKGPRCSWGGASIDAEHDMLTTRLQLAQTYAQQTRLNKVTFNGVAVGAGVVVGLLADLSVCALEAELATSM